MATQKSSNAPTTTSNKLKKIREDKLLSRSELARLAGISPLTLTRVESGESCRIDIKRRIILALGYSVEDFNKIF